MPGGLLTAVTELTAVKRFGCFWLNGLVADLPGTAAPGHHIAGSFCCKTSAAKASVNQPGNYLIKYKTAKA